MSRLASIAVLATLTVGSATARAQVSPGPLSRAHQNLDGALDCRKCHGGHDHPMAARCQDCHAEIAWLIEHRRGVHGQPGHDDCAACHKEHGGRDHELTPYPGGDPRKFDHRETGWGLEGGHAVLRCEQCHKTALQVSDSIRLSPRKDKQNSFIGLEPTCSACHSDIHRGRLGEDCRACHRTEAWTETHHFDHARTGYPLTGKHTSLACEKCHRNRSREAAATRKAVFEPLRHDECSACHDDIHRGRLGPTCSTCHVTEAFAAVNRKSFDHTRTAYPLEGRHVQVACEKCHDPADRSPFRRPRHERCEDCHAESHGGQLANLMDHEDCASCHRVEGWKPSTFGVTEHARLTFRLDGRHGRIECVACHRPENGNVARLATARRLGRAQVAFDLGDPSCEDCHEDPHEGRFGPTGKRPIDDGCRICHGFERFRPSLLDAENHRRVGFPIDGAHREVACEKCHKRMQPPGTALNDSTVPASLDPRPVDFTVEKDCASCHKGPHGDQFASRRDGGACEGCHGQETFRPATAFDHDRQSRFPLFRSHGKVLCERCHEKREDALGRLVAIYRPISLACKECHRRIAPTAPGGSAFGSLPTRR